MESWLFQYSLGGQQFPGLFRFNLPQMIRQQYQRLSGPAEQVSQIMPAGPSTASASMISTAVARATLAVSRSRADQRIQSFRKLRSSSSVVVQDMKIPYAFEMVQTAGDPGWRRLASHKII